MTSPGQQAHYQSSCLDLRYNYDNHNNQAKDYDDNDDDDDMVYSFVLRK